MDCTKGIFLDKRTFEEKKMSIRFNGQSGPVAVQWDVQFSIMLYNSGNLSGQFPAEGRSSDKGRDTCRELSRDYISYFPDHKGRLVASRRSNRVSRRNPN